MPLFEEGLPAASSAAQAEEDRRFNGRNKFLAQVQIRSIDPPHRECVGTMRDLSRDGMYFVVRSHNYAIGARLHLTLPRSGSEWTCEVVRTETLPSGGQGVGVRILAFGS
jgi:PilZ domain